MMKYPKLIRIANAFIDVAFVKFLLLPYLVDPFISGWYSVILHTRIHRHNIFIDYRLPIVLFVYYFATEAITGKTLGKLITRTVVVDQKGQKPDSVKILIRTLIRFIPFIDALSFFGKDGLHDSMSDTKLITVSNTDKAKDEIKELLLETKIALQSKAKS